MKRKFDMDNEMPLKDRWGVLQEKIGDIEAIEFKEKNIAKEGVCEECGVFDVLSKFNERFICSECIKLFSLKAKKNYR